MKSKINQVIALVFMFSFICYSQQIVNLSHFQPHYNATKKEISLSGGNPNVLKQFLHELGHHIWFYGGVDTLEYKKMFTDNNIWERFANEHYYYFLDETDYYHKEIFDKFYNKEDL